MEKIMIFGFALCFAVIILNSPSQVQNPCGMVPSSHTNEVEMESRIMRKAINVNKPVKENVHPEFFHSTE